MEDTTAAFLDRDTILADLSRTMKSNINLNDKDIDANGAQETDDFDEEYQTIDSELDKMFSALDALEKKNDSLYNQLQDLLQQSRGARAHEGQQNPAHSEK